MRRRSHSWLQRWLCVLNRPRIWRNSVRLKVVHDFSRYLLKHLFCQPRSGVLHLPIWQKLHDISTHLLASRANQRDVVSIEDDHVFKARGSNPNDNDRYGVLGCGDDGILCRLHVVDITVCENEEHKVLLVGLANRGLLRITDGLLDDRRKMSRPGEFHKRHGCFIGVHHSLKPLHLRVSLVKRHWKTVRNCPVN
jgi:hypothetical protein